MDDVIDNCQVTFEEDGINQQTLNDLRTVGPSFSYRLFSRYHDGSSLRTFPDRRQRHQLLDLVPNMTCYRIWCMVEHFFVTMAGRNLSDLGWAKAGGLWEFCILGGSGTL